ncbi:hypothetical protein GCM10007205_20830 [Oxalicibacterium flavum]|uniref:Uncharacterized protein n=1 Tax=Oxalicibacterium flavum TaxID=179467 RepID=A0A8J2UN51_9BURK|nr:hypothetical protein [Oxalicibacterium flavum]GGC11514.1 hypothetical protein GCM10007205_20830 [Oxalicibacterium flavum]
MTKLKPILAGAAVAMFSQFAAAQSAPATAPAQIVVPAESAPANPNDPAYTDQSRLNYTNDPYVKKRVATAEARADYKAEKGAAKDEYKAEKKAAKEEYRAEKREARQERREEVRQMNQGQPPVDPVTGKPSTPSDPVVPATTR